MRYGLLGRLEVIVDDGHEIAFRAQKVRETLARQRDLPSKREPRTPIPVTGQLPR
jgi:hypothetical protein